MLTTAECMQFACILEATARKPGNVHRFCDFDDLTYLDFLLSAAVIGPILEQAPVRGVGPVVLDAIRATRRVVSTNTNLGIVLLLAPLAAVPRDRNLRSGVAAVLCRLTIDDSRAVFEAIRLANPGGLGSAPEQDVRAEPTVPLREIMALAADRDLIARQYANGFHDVFEIGVPSLLAGSNPSPSPPRSGEGRSPVQRRSVAAGAALSAIDTGFNDDRPSPPRGGEGEGFFALEAAIIRCHLRLLAANPDSHIARRCGLAEALEVSRRAADVLAGADVAAFDSWLREDGHRRNPGATADLVTACLFVALREGIITLPAPFRSR